MARHKRCVAKRRRKEEGKRRKRQENEEKMADQIEKKSPCASFSSAQSSFFGSIRNTLFRERHTISAFVFMQVFR